ncbi:T9SS type A sorting domain-containing protein, partial [bacterium]|nr:T9SS type A sorting domain-containing protein [bacterium]
ENVKNYVNRYQTFEIIIYDPAHYPTDTGDCIIDVQYKDVDNYDTQNGYATVGLQNLDHSDGLTYTYWNQYAPGAATLQAGRAIRIMPIAPVDLGTIAGHIDIAEPVNRAAEGVTVAVIGSGRIFSTNVDGDYMGSVPVGTYDVIAYHPSLEPDTLYNVDITLDQTATCDFTLMDIGGPFIVNTTVLEGTDDTTGPYVVNTTIADFSGVADMHFYYMTSGSGAINELTLNATGGNDYAASIPGQATGTRVRYWITATDELGLTSCQPESSPVESYSFRIDEPISHYDDMESDTGWTVGADGDDATTGIWTRVDPNGIEAAGTQVVPEDDATLDPGTMCFITGQSSEGANQGEEDVDGGTTTLLSPVYNLNGYNDVTVTYKRWYTNDTGYSPSEDSWVVEVTDGSSWVSLENTMSSNRSWATKSFSLDGVIDMTSSVQFRFIASDFGGGSVVEAGVDEFILTGYTGTYDSESPQVTVLSPNGGESFNSENTIDVDFNASDNTSVAGTLIMLSYDNGTSWPVIASGSASAPATFTLPDRTSEMARIRVVAFDDQLNMRDDVSDGYFTIEDGASAVNNELPHSVLLNGNYPNPFNPSTEISFALPSQGKASLRVFDTAGRLVRTLVSGELAAGNHIVTWNGKTDNGSNTASGVYFYRLDTESKSMTRKMLLLK